MLAALGASVLIVPLLTPDITADEDAIFDDATINDRLRRLAPYFYINRVVDVVAVFVLAFLDAAGEVSDHGAAFKGPQLRLANDADDAGCVQTHCSGSRGDAIGLLKGQDVMKGIQHPRLAER